MTRRKISIQTVTLWAMLWGILFYTALNVGTNRVPLFSTVMRFATSPVFWTLAIVSLIGIYYVVKWSMQHKTT